MQRAAPAIHLCLPGAFIVALYGSLAAGFAGCGNPNRFAHMCLAFWGVFGGASFGATPGLLWGYFRGLKWVSPFLGAGVGFRLGLLPELLGGGGDVNSTGPTYAALVFFGFILGSWRSLADSRNAPK